MYFASESSTQAFSLYGSLNDTSPFKVLQSPWPPIKGSVDFIQVERLSFRKSLYKAAEQEPGITDPDACAFLTTSARCLGVREDTIKCDHSGRNIGSFWKAEELIP